MTDYFRQYYNYREEEVPAHFREPFIHSGYRDPRSSWILCINSLFFPTNETVNVWSHLLPSFYFISCLISELIDLTFVFYDYYYAPFIIYIGTIVIYTLISSLAHLFNTMSDWARHVCFICDYAAVSIHAHGTALAFFAYSIPMSWIDKTSIGIFSNNFIFLSLVSCILSVVLSCHTRLHLATFRLKLMRFSAFVSPCLITISPVFIRSLYCYIDDNSGNIDKDCKEDFQEYWYYQICFSLLAATFYVSHFPERVYPGRFDIFGHSHQLFHMACIVNSYFQMQLIKSDSMNRKQLLESHSRLPNFSNTYAPFAIVVVSNVLLSVYFILQIRMKTKNTSDWIRYVICDISFTISMTFPGTVSL